MIWLQKKFVSRYKRKERHKTTHTHTHIIHLHQKTSICSCTHYEKYLPERWIDFYWLYCYYCIIVCRMSRFLFYSCLSLIFILSLCVLLLHMFFILCPKSYTLFSHIFMFLNNKWWTYWFRIYWPMTTTVCTYMSTTTWVFYYLF